MQEQSEIASDGSPDQDKRKAGGPHANEPPRAARRTERSFAQSIGTAVGILD